MVIRISCTTKHSLLNNSHKFKYYTNQYIIYHPIQEQPVLLIPYRSILLHGCLCSVPAGAECV